MFLVVSLMPSNRVPTAGFHSYPTSHVASLLEIGFLSSIKIHLIKDQNWYTTYSHPFAVNKAKYFLP